jgi:hypothetical protein
MNNLTIIASGTFNDTVLHFYRCPLRGIVLNFTSIVAIFGGSWTSEQDDYIPIYNLYQMIESLSDEPLFASLKDWLINEHDNIVSGYIDIKLREGFSRRRRYVSNA